MRILGIAGLVLALAIVGYLVASYLQEGSKIQETLQTVPGSSGAGPPVPKAGRAGRPGEPVDVSKRGLQQRLAPTLDQERQRVQDANKAASE